MNKQLRPLMKTRNLCSLPRAQRVVHLNLTERCTWTMEGNHHVCKPSFALETSTNEKDEDVLRDARENAFACHRVRHVTLSVRDRYPQIIYNSQLTDVPDDILSLEHILRNGPRFNLSGTEASVMCHKGSPHYAVPQETVCAFSRGQWSRVRGTS